MQFLFSSTDFILNRFHLNLFEAISDFLCFDRTKPKEEFYWVIIGDSDINKLYSVKRV